MNRSYGYVSIFLYLIFLNLGFLIKTGHGQTKQSNIHSNNQEAQYYLGTEDELLIKVNVWGFVAHPGQYFVSSDTDLISLLSHVGGPTENANLKKIKIVRITKDEEKIIKINVKQFINTASRNLIPKLLPGDTVIVPSSRMYLVNKFFEYASRVAIVVQMAWYITLINRE